jgi:hypothetical protein
MAGRSVSSDNGTTSAGGPPSASTQTDNVPRPCRHAAPRGYTSDARCGEARNAGDNAASALRRGE